MALVAESVFAAMPVVVYAVVLPSNVVGRIVAAISRVRYSRHGKRRNRREREQRFHESRLHPSGSSFLL